MRLRLSSSRPCRLRRGQVRRVPQRVSARLVGYHVCCPRCGFITIALHGYKGLRISEACADASLLLTLSEPMRCTYCAVLIHIADGDARLEEDAHVRPVRYR